MADWPLVVVHHVRWLRPGTLVLDERVHERERLAHPAAVGRAVSPQVVCSGREHPGERSHHVELEQRVAEWFGARQLAWEAAVGGHLLGDEGLAKEAPHGV